MKTFVLILLSSEGFWDGFVSGIVSGLLVSFLIGVFRWGFKKGVFIKILEPDRHTNKFKVYNSGYFSFTDLTIKSQISCKGLIPESPNISILQVPVDENIPYICNSLSRKMEFWKCCKYHLKSRTNRTEPKGSLFTLYINQIRTNPTLNPEITTLNGIVNNYKKVKLTIYITHVGRFTGIKKTTKRTFPLERIPVPFIGTYTSSPNTPTTS